MAHGSRGPRDGGLLRHVSLTAEDQGGGRGSHDNQRYANRNQKARFFLFLLGTGLFLEKAGQTAAAFIFGFFSCSASRPAGLGQEIFRLRRIGKDIGKFRCRREGVVGL